LNPAVTRLAGWGRYPVADCVLYRAAGPGPLLGLLPGLPDAIARGNGRSYGDASLNESATLDMRRLDRLIDFDHETGVVTCESGVLLSEVIDAMLPLGWFPAVTPGTQFVTVGGLIASDVHGKNHHRAGSFCDYVQWMDLAIGDATVLRCSSSQNADLFAATCGGMGLTGIILRASFRLLRVETAMILQRRVRVPNLSEAFSVFEQSLDSTYSVAWIDCLARGRNLGRCAILLGEHARGAALPPARRSKPLARPVRRRIPVPLEFPAFFASGTAVRLFNRIYYAAQTPGDSVVEIDPYFYPLDMLVDWNRIYGPRGFVQHQCVLPLDGSRDGMKELLKAISGAGVGSFLAVLKRMGRNSFGLLSFPMEGYTLALDFPVSRDSFALLERLDAITAAYGGRIYLTKDARSSAAFFASGYPRLEAFRNVRRAYGLDTRFSSLLSRRLEI
jgi:decaprenylphospho-beta-D-ribofuranose 2-oxidase